MTLSGSKRIAGVVGWPIAHSLSPQLHGFWLREYGLGGAYVPLPVRPHEFSVALRGLARSGFKGLNITLPHKEAAFALADECDGAAVAAGAANIILFRGERVRAQNSDAEGLAASLEEQLGADAIREGSVVILGAGGASRAAILACDSLGAREIHVLNRSSSRANDVVARLTAHAAATIGAISLDEWPALAPAVRLVINATSAGMKGSASPAVSLESLPSDAAVCDLVYNPLETPLLARAKARKLRAIDGLGMLMHQAVPAFESFYGIRPEVSASLRAHLEEALRGGA
ncbi:MAG TPA: shikimate dehydrogenase [Rhizomicrobium sp.]|nr:shikimate dehydrogenase [Rhizomicrobium sp.]